MPDTPAPTLTIRLLGPFAVEGLRLPTRKAEALLAYLALGAGRPYRREGLMELLWGERGEKQARHSLSQTLFTLRKALGEAAGCIVSDAAVVTFDARDAAIDAVAFERAAGQADPASLAEAAGLYAGELLQGFNLREIAFQNWLTVERARFKDLAVDVLTRLCAARERDGDLGGAMQAAAKLLGVDPLQEEAHRALMRLHMAQGRPAAALRQYEQCAAILRRELDTEPEAETRALQREVLRRRQYAPPPARAAAASEPPAARPPAAAPSPAQGVRFCTARDGANIAFSETGAEPALVKAGNWLTHLDFDWHSPIWRPLFSELSDFCRLVRYDPRGTGLSDWDTTSISFEAWVDDLAAVADAAGLERFALLGVSQGSAVSIAYAHRCPERVSHLILLNGHARGRRRRGKAGASEYEAALNLLIRNGWGQDHVAHRQMFSALFLPEGTPEQVRWFAELERVSTSPDNAVRIRETSGGCDVTALLPEIRVPTLVLHARCDAVVPFEEGRLVASAIPGARFVPLDSCNHLLLPEEPAWPRLLEEIRGFMMGDAPSEPPLDREAL